VYLEAVRTGSELPFVCQQCRSLPSVSITTALHSTRVDGAPADPPPPIDVSSIVEPPRASDGDVDPTANATAVSGVTAVSGEVAGSDTAASVNVSLSDTSHPPEAAPPVLQESSLWDEEPVDASDDDDQQDSATYAVTYHVIRRGSTKSKDLLTDSDGYSYTLKPTKSASYKYWRCVVRNRTTTCRATVIEDDDGFRAGQYAHICTPKIGVAVARTVTAAVSIRHCAYRPIQLG